MKTASLSFALLLGLIWRGVSGPTDKPLDFSQFPQVVSTQTVNNVLVKANPNPFQVIVSIDGKSDLRIDTMRALPRKLDSGERVALEEDLLFYEKTGKYEKAQDLVSYQQHKKYSTPVHTPIAVITPLTPAPAQSPASPKPSANPI
jgi:hypothetical protein